MPKCDKDCNTPKVLEIHNHECPVLFHRVIVPAAIGDDETNPPRNGQYRNVLLVYEANGHVYLFSSDGIPTFISDGGQGVDDYNELENKPSINGHELIGDSSLEDLGVDEAISDALEDYTPTSELSEVALSGDYNDLSNTPTIPVVNDATLTITRNNVSAGTFTANSATDTSINIAVPTAISDLTNDSGFITNTVNNLVNYYTKTETDTAIGVETSNRENADQGLQEQIDALASASDVVDVVGTYAELQAYDTSYLNDNDIVKVLTDETHNNAISYYRWNDTTDAFTYIGSQGPFYTKSETDATFVPQTRTVNGKALSSDIVLTASDVNALPASTVIPTVNNATLTIKKNGNNVASFTANSATDIAADISVPTATSDLTNDSGFLSAGTDCASGSSFQITGIEGAPLTLTELKGNAEQNGTPTPDAPIAVNTVTGEQTVKITGKNLFDKDNANILIAYIDASHTSITYNSNNRIIWIPCQPNTTYTLQKLAVGTSWFARQIAYTTQEPAVGVQTYSMADMTGNDTSKSYTTGADAKYLVVRIWVSGQDAETFDAMLGSIQLELGSTATAYEPYHGQSYEINLGKNLFDTDTAATRFENIGGSQMNDWGTYQDGIVTIVKSNGAHGTCAFAGFKPTLVEGETYTLSATIRLSGTNATNQIRFGIVQNSPNIAVSGKDVWIDVSKTFVATATDVSDSRVDIQAANTGNIIETKNIQLERGSQATSFAPYFTPIELAKIGNYQDRIYKNDGKWYIEKQVGKVVLDGTETWMLNESGTGYVRFTTVQSGIITSFSNSQIYTMSDKFVASTQTETVNANADANRVCVVTNGRLLFKTLDTSLNTVAKWQTWLGTNKPSVYYALATPTTTEITDSTLLAQLNFIANLYEGTNTVMLVGTGAQGEITVCHSDVSRVAITGSYNDLTDKPTIPTVNDATLTIQKNGVNVTTFTANSATNATANIVVPTKTSDLTNDGADNTSTYVEADELATVATSGSYNDLSDKPDIMTGLTEMSYGESNAWAKFLAAYRAKQIVYCRASSNANPASGSQTRKAFMAYVNNAENPTNVEFQYVRSVNAKTAAQPVDQVYVYTLDNRNGGTWTVATRNMAPKLAQGTNTTVSYSNGTYTISATGGGGGPTVVQTTGQSTTDVMSQKAVTDIIGNVETILQTLNNGGGAQ